MKKAKITITVLTVIAYFIMIGLMIGMSTSPSQLIALSVPAIMLAALLGVSLLFVWTK